MMIKTSKKILIIDNYVDDSILNMLTNIKKYIIINLLIV